MSEDSKERWRELCEQATTESNPEKLLELVTEINRLLEIKQAGHAEQVPSTSPEIKSRSILRKKSQRNAA